MIATLEVKDANGTTHTVELLCAEGEDEQVLLERASQSLMDWFALGTTKAVGPFTLESCVVRDAE